MTSFIKIAALTLAIATGAATANADELLQSLASQGHIVTTQGIAGSR